jgi:hypothetical protein
MTVGSFADAIHRIGPALAVITDQPLMIGHIQIGGRQIEVWADRPARTITRVFFTDDHGHACGDALQRDADLTMELPHTWSADDRAVVEQVIVALVYRPGEQAVAARR